MTPRSMYSEVALGTGPNELLTGFTNGKQREGRVCVWLLERFLGELRYGSLV